MKRSNADEQRYQSLLAGVISSAMTQVDEAAIKAAIVKQQVHDVWLAMSPKTKTDKSIAESTRMSLQHRRHIRFHPEMGRVLQLYWKNFEFTVSHITIKQFVNVAVKIGKVLSPFFNYGDYFIRLEKDLKRNPEHARKKLVSQDWMFNFLFEVADITCLSVHPLTYSRVLEQIFEQIALPERKKGERRGWRKLKDVKFDPDSLATGRNFSKREEVLDVCKMAWKDRLDRLTLKWAVTSMWISLMKLIESYNGSDREAIVLLWEQLGFGLPRDYKNNINNGKKKEQSNDGGGDGDDDDENGSREEGRGGGGKVEIIHSSSRSSNHNKNFESRISSNKYQSSGKVLLKNNEIRLRIGEKQQQQQQKKNMFKSPALPPRHSSSSNSNSSSSSSSSSSSICATKPGALSSSYHHATRITHVTRARVLLQDMKVRSRLRNFLSLAGSFETVYLDSLIQRFESSPSSSSLLGPSHSAKLHTRLQITRSKQISPRTRMMRMKEESTPSSSPWTRMMRMKEESTPSSSPWNYRGRCRQSMGGGGGRGGIRAKSDSSSTNTGFSSIAAKRNSSSLIQIRRINVSSSSSVSPRLLGSRVLARYGATAGQTMKIKSARGRFTSTLSAASPPSSQTQYNHHRHYDRDQRSAQDREHEVLRSRIISNLRLDTNAAKEHRVGGGARQGSHHPSGGNSSRSGGGGGKISGRRGRRMDPTKTENKSSSTPPFSSRSSTVRRYMNVSSEEEEEEEGEHDHRAGCPSGPRTQLGTSAAVVPPAQGVAKGIVNDDDKHAGGGDGNNAAAAAAAADEEEQHQQSHKLLADSPPISPLGRESFTGLLEEAHVIASARGKKPDGGSHDRHAEGRSKDANEYLTETDYLKLPPSTHDNHHLSSLRASESPSPPPASSSSSSPLSSHVKPGMTAADADEDPLPFPISKISPSMQSLTSVATSVPRSSNIKYNLPLKSSSSSKKGLSALSSSRKKSSTKGGVKQDIINRAWESSPIVRLKVSKPPPVSRRGLRNSTESKLTSSSKKQQRNLRSALQHRRVRGKSLLDKKKNRSKAANRIRLQNTQVSSQSNDRHHFLQHRSSTTATSPPKRVPITAHHQKQHHRYPGSINLDSTKTTTLVEKNHKQQQQQGHRSSSLKKGRRQSGTSNYSPVRSRGNNSTTTFQASNRSSPFMVKIRVRSTPR